MSKEAEDKKDFLQQIKAPVIACTVALLALVILLIPGVLTYPEDLEQYDSKVQEDKLLKIAQQHNTMLRQRIDGLRSALDDGMCLVDGEYLNQDGKLLSNSIQQNLPQSPVAVTQACADASSGEFVSLKELILSSTVLVTKRGEGGSIGIGTGFFIDDQRILTNAHVVEGDGASNRILIFSTKFEPVEAKMIAIGDYKSGTDSDLAVLFIDSVNGSAPLAFANVEQSSRVRSAGYPGHIIANDLNFINATSNPESVKFDKEPVIDSGEVIMKQEEKDGVWLYHDAYIAKGNSGGPLLDKCGRVVGVNTQIQAGKGSIQTPVSKSISLETIQAFFRTRNLEPFTISNTPLPEDI